MVRRICAAVDCSEVLDGRARKWCSEACRQRMWHRQKREKERLGIDNVVSIRGHKGDYKTRAESKDGRASARRGPKYEKFLETDLPELIARGNITVAEAALELEDSAANVSRWMAAYTQDKANDQLRRDWKIDEQVRADIDDGYETFVRRFHPDVLVPDFHLEWEAELDSVVGNAGRLLLLAPQRHGKTDFLIRYCQRRITRDPDICILWVSRSKELAEEAVGYLRQLLEDDDYCETVLGPGNSFKPPTRSGKSWTDEKFTVAQRTRARKSPTVRALGIGGTVSGRDADLIIIDDPQEREDCESPATSTKQHRWFFSTFLARKMPHTGIAFITSRKGHNDIPATIIGEHTDDGDPSKWKVLTYQAHDPGCIKRERDYDAHVDCVLWPSVRPWQFLLGQKLSDEQFFQCNYQNDPTVEKLVLVTRDDIAEATTPEFFAGHFPPGWRLIAGFDPATAKPTAAVLWAYSHKERRAQIVAAQRFRTGTAGFNEAINEWHRRFRCIDWVWEKGGGNNAFIQDTVVQASLRALGVRATDHYTDRSNKVDSAGGVTSMIQQIRAGKIIFPSTHDDEPGEGVRRLIAQILNYDAEYVSRSKHADDDLVMAMWFPWWQKIQSVVGSGAAAIEVEATAQRTFYPQSTYGSSTRYGGT